MKRILIIAFTLLSLSSYAQVSPSIEVGGKKIDLLALSDTNRVIHLSNIDTSDLQDYDFQDFDPTTKLNITDTAGMLAHYASSNKVKADSTTLRAAIPTNNNQLTNGSNFITASGGTLSGNLSITSTNPTFTIQYPSNRFLQLLAGASGGTFNFDKNGYFAIYGASSISDIGTAPTDYYKVFGATGNTLIGNNSYNTPDSNWKVDITSSGTNGTLRVFDNKASTGLTKVSLREGAGQGSNDIFNVYSNDGATKRFSINNGNVTGAQYRLSALNTAPTSATDTGTLGEIRITSGFIYVCTAANTWVRAALATW